MRDKIPSFIVRMKVNMKICQYFVEIMICLPFSFEKTKPFEKWSPQR